MDQSKNIKLYAAYLEEKVACYREMQCDYVRGDSAKEKLCRMKWKDGLLKEISFIQKLIKELLNARFYLDSVNNEVTTEALRLLVKDLLKLFQAENEAVILMLRT